MDAFILSYLKVVKKLYLEEESHVIAECIIEDIIQKVESTNSLIPIMQTNNIMNTTNEN